MKTAAEQAEQALKDGTITQDQYDGLQREIVETEQKLKSLEEQAKQSGTALQEIAAKGEKLKTVGDNVTNVGKKFMPVTLGVVGLSTAAVKEPFLVKVSISDLNIRTGPGTDYDRVQFIPIGVYTIVEVRSGKGSSTEWGRLKSGIGWISLDFVRRI